jgi:ABC-type transporter Mla subunit MlaD
MMLKDSLNSNAPTGRVDWSAMTSSIQVALEELIAKVDQSQPLIDELRLELRELKAQNQEQMKEIEGILLQLSQVQKELEHYFLLNQRLFDTIKASEKLQNMAVNLLVSRSNN